MSFLFNNSKTRLIMAIAVLFCVQSCAQQKELVKKTHAFYTERLPGNVPVDPETGQVIVRRDTIITVYLETNTDGIKWDTAWINGYKMHINVSPVTNNPFEAGITKSGNEKVVLTPAKGNFLWRLDFEPVPSRASYIPRNNSIRLKGSYKNKPVIQTIDTLTELEGHPSY